MSPSPKHAFWLLVLVSAPFLAGCVGSGDSPDFVTRYSCSVPGYLYASGERPPQVGRVRLSLPLRVGVVFVPAPPPTVRCGGFHRAFRDSRYEYQQELSESDRLALMRRVAACFESLPYIERIETLPSSSLARNGGFESLDILAETKDIRVAVLLSHDQVQRTNLGPLALSYWTIVGMMFLPAEKNVTDTMLDAAVVDIASRRVLFRAPGTSQVQSNVGPPEWLDRIRRDSADGFRLATDSLLPNLQVQLERFQERVDHSPGEFQVDWAR